MRHGAYDEFWRARSLPPHLKNVTPAVMTVGGLFDAEDLYGPVKIYETIESTSPKAFNMLVLGPWFHGQWARDPGDRIGCAQWGSATSRWYNDNVELPFFEYFLKDKGELRLPEAVVFNTGANAWRQFAAWPPKNLRAGALYFGPDGSLTSTPPADAANAADSFPSDPANPVPFTDDITIVRSREYMTEDQRFASRRPDVLAYTTPPLTEDLTIAGPITADIVVATTGTDADWVVKVIDVFPDDAPDADEATCRVPLSGYEMLVRWEIMRGKFRNSFEKPEPFVPNRPTPVTFQLRDVCHTFKKGHRVMVQIQSSMFPLVDRNPQTFVDIYSASEADFKKATHTLYRSAAHPSRISFGILGP
jgi:putative CocE/NonD family hydrolase